MKRFLTLAVVTLLLAACAAPAPRMDGADRSVSILLVRHGETVSGVPTIPLNAQGLQRAQRLLETLRGIRVTHVFASHTTRTRQMVEPVAAVHRVPVVQLPAPGSAWEGQAVNDQTSRRAPIEPIAQALLALPPGSTALVGLNSENIYAILHRLGVPQSPPGQPCAAGVMCVPCTDNTCYPRDEFDHLWHLVLRPGQPGPVAYVELRYAAGWRP